MKNIKYGYCHCGCGLRTNIAKLTNKRLGHIKGEPVKFIPGHNAKIKHPMSGKFGKDSPNWKGGKFVCKNRNTSYVLIRRPDHPRSHSDGYIYEHILIVEKALGFSIGSEAVVHHIDLNGLNNELSNLMVFNCSADHLRFHAEYRREQNAC